MMFQKNPSRIFQRIKSIGQCKSPIDSFRLYHSSSSRLNKKDNTANSTATPSTKEKKESIAEADERIRRMLLDRDGGPASVPTREGKWDNDMGRETARHMFRVLDQARHAKPGAQNAQGEGESKHWSRRNY